MNKTESSTATQPTSESLPSGFRFAGVAAGIKPSGNPDISLIVADKPVVVAGVYTQNQVIAAPVAICRDRTPSDSIRAVITNSGNANACTGDQGVADANAMCRTVAEHIGCAEEQVLVMSTGLIGEVLPMESVRKGIKVACESLSSEDSAFTAAAEAIRTTDKDRKTASCLYECESGSVRIAAMAKGAGMIAPNMATMLAVVMTDANLRKEDAQALLSEAAEISFNRVSVDQHTSTNDTLLLMASGEGAPLSGQELSKFAENLNKLSIDLAKQLVSDGEGATHFMAIHVHGAASDKDANQLAKTIGDSPLVKTAITGGDPNWGRIVSAAGYAGVPIDCEQSTLRICGVTIYEDGSPVPFDEASLSQKMKSRQEIEVDLKVGSRDGKATRWASDLTTEYVRFNSEYTT